MALKIVDFDLQENPFQVILRWDSVNEVEVYRNDVLLGIVNDCQFIDSSIEHFDIDYIYTVKSLTTLESDSIEIPTTLYLPSSPIVLDAGASNSYKSISLFISCEENVEEIMIYKNDELIFQTSEYDDLEDHRLIYAFDDGDVEANQHYTYKITCRNQYGICQEALYVTIFTYHMIPQVIHPNLIQRKYEKSVYIYFNKIDHVLDYRIHYRFNNQEYHYSLLNDNPYDVLKSDELENYIDCCITCSNEWGESPIDYKRYALKKYEIEDVEKIVHSQCKEHLLIEWEAIYHASKYYIQIYDLYTNELLSEEVVRSNHYHYTLPFKHIYIYIQSSNEWSYSNGVYYFFDHEIPSKKKHQKALIINNTSFPNGNKSAYDFKMLLNHYHIETKHYWNLSVEELEIVLKIFSMNSNEDDMTYILLNGHGSKNGIGICKDEREDEYILYTYLKNCFDSIKGEKVLFIDACFSGNFIQKNDLLSNYHHRLSKQFFTNQHYHILTSSSPSQRTWIFDYSYSKAMYYWCYCCGLDVKKEKWIEPIHQEITLNDIYEYTSLHMKKDNEHYLQTQSKEDDIYIQDICIYPKEDHFKIF